MSLRILENVPLAPMTTLQVGGPARYFADAATEADVEEAFKYARERGLKIFVLGGGSNVLVSDNGFEGLVIRVVPKGVSRDDSIVTAAAGEDWDGLVSYCVANDLAGVECLSGIPGLVGGTPVQNVGAYGQEVSETIRSVRCFDASTFDFVDLTDLECGFEYRKSIFNTVERDRYVVLAVTYVLTSDGKPRVAYKDLQDLFLNAEPTLREVREAVLNIRRSKSMVIDPVDPNSKSAGSFFKNPIVSIETAESIAADMIRNMPRFRVNDSEVKIPAAWLIENAGFSKGFVYGNAGISANHALAIVNRGNAAAAEIVALKELLQNAVYEKFGIELVPEPVFVGF